MSKWLLIAAGTICVVLGTLGIFLPLLPTTPFLLLAAAAYIRSSQRFYDWLLTNRVFGTYIRDYREGRGIPLGTKIMGLSLLWITIGYSFLYMTDNWVVRGILVVIVIGVTVHLVTLKTLRRGC
ncbi:MAG: YbaN family protein [Fidelibacterota bacterium]|nr:MAG: YbaN family protein [Candidatus Neomarinimicrobiota bacterium]